MALLGASYFSLSENFDYHKFLEERSHFVELHSDISSDIKTQTHEIVDQLDDLKAATESLDYNISSKLDNIEMAIAEQTEIIDFQFTSLIVEQRHMNATLDELLATAKAPSFTAAHEQFSLARDYFKRKLFPEAYEAICQAIDGSRYVKGYPHDHRFFTLKGILQLGSFENFSEDFIDPKSASINFQQAARLVQGNDPVEASLSNSRAAWAEYCAGDKEKSKSLLKIALSINPHNADAHYCYGRILVAEGFLRQGEQHLVKAVHQNVLFLEAAFNDDVLKNKQETLRNVNEKAISTMRRDIEHLNTELQRCLEQLPPEAPKEMKSRVETMLPIDSPDNIATGFELREKGINTLMVEFDELAGLSKNRLDQKKQLKSELENFNEEFSFLFLVFGPPFVLLITYFLNSDFWNFMNDQNTILLPLLIFFGPSVAIACYKIRQFSRDELNKKQEIETLTNAEEVFRKCNEVLRDFKTRLAERKLSLGIATASG